MRFSENHGFDFEIRRMLGLSYNGGCDIEEVLSIVGKIGYDDDEGWFRELSKLAEGVRKQGDESASRGHQRSACEAYLRASIYHFFSDFYVHADPALKVAAGRASRQCFMDSIPGLDYEVEAVSIPFEGAHLPAYAMKKRGLPAGRHPTLLCHSGFDGNKEESAVFPGRPAADRGYVVLVFDGPGQGEAVRELGLYMRPDWDVVLSAAVDYALGRDDVDPDRIGYMGISFGGVLSPMAASKEHRIHALIANGGVYNFHWAVRKFLGVTDHPLGNDGQTSVTDDAIAALDERIKTSPEARWGVNQGRYIFNARDTRDYIERTPDFWVEGAENIRCPTLVIDSELEQYFAGQPEILFDKLTCPKTLMKFSADEAAAQHYQAGGQADGARRMLDWLDEVLNHKA